MRVRATARGLRVEVHDGNPALPAKRQATPMDEGGRGIALVEALSSGWGAESTEDGKRVWFEVAAARRLSAGEVRSPPGRRAA